jgi:TetR/AcrR family transcriptional repressor of nem operon
MARPRSFDADQALTAARDQFWSTGYAGTSIDEVAAATGLGKGSLYGAFGDKRALFLRVFDEYCAAVTTATRDALGGPDADAFARLCDHLHAVADATAADTELRGCFLANSTAELANRDEAVATRARQTFADLRQLIADCIVAAQRVGDIAADAEPGALASMILAVLRGIEALGKGGCSRAELRAAAETAVALLPRSVPGL